MDRRPAAQERAAVTMGGLASGRLGFLLRGPSFSRGGRYGGARLEIGGLDDLVIANPVLEPLYDVELLTVLHMVVYVGGHQILDRGGSLVGTCPGSPADLGGLPDEQGGEVLLLALANCARISSARLLGREVSRLVLDLSCRMDNFRSLCDAVPRSFARLIGEIVFGTAEIDQRLPHGDFESPRILLSAGHEELKVSLGGVGKLSSVKILHGDLHGLSEIRI